MRVRCRTDVRYTCSSTTVAVAINVRKLVDRGFIQGKSRGKAVVLPPPRRQSAAATCVAPAAAARQAASSPRHGTSWGRHIRQATICMLAMASVA